MARTKMNGVEKGGRCRKRKIVEEETEESEEEEPKTRQVFKKNYVYHVREWVPDPDTVSGEPANGTTSIPVTLKEITRLELPHERVQRKAAYAEAKRIDAEKKLEYWLKTIHPVVHLRKQRLGLNKLIQYAASTNCLLGYPSFDRIVKNPQVFVSCIQVQFKKVSAVGRDIKVFVVVGMLVELFSRPENPVLLHSIIMHQEAPHR